MKKGVCLQHKSTECEGHTVGVLHQRVSPSEFKYYFGHSPTEKGGCDCAVFLTTVLHQRVSPGEF